jgi:hypothetical protein
MNEKEQSDIERSRLVGMSLYAKYAAFMSDFLPDKTRQNECPYYLRTGKMVDLNLLKLKCFGPPGIYSLIDGPIHQRAPVEDEGGFDEKQGSVLINNRKSNDRLQFERLYPNQVVQTDVDQQTRTETTMRGASLKGSILKDIRQLRPQKEKYELAQEKSRRSKRRKNEKRWRARIRETSMTGESDPSTMKRPKPNTNPKKTERTGTKVAKVGDLVSAPATFFDIEPGSFSSKYPERCFVAVDAVSAEGLVRVRWVEDNIDDNFEDNTEDECKVRHLTVEKIADIGTKALHRATFVRLRDLMNGHELVKAGYTKPQLSQLVCSKIHDEVISVRTILS